MNLQDLAQSNFNQHIANNSYPGRGIVIGRMDDGQWVQIYWIMGRSENSRNRVFNYLNGVLRTEPADPSKVEDPSLIIYNGMREWNQHFIVTNGSHTDTIFDGFEAGQSLAQALRSEFHEPDPPNNTPRISGVLNLSEEEPEVVLSIIKASAFVPSHSERHFFHYTTIEPGMGYGITTYQEDGSPLPSFQGIPLLLPTNGPIRSLLDNYWSYLDQNNRISLAIKVISQQNRQSSVLLINKHSAG